MDPMDEYLGKLLKNWAAMRRPPVNGKARLLRAAEFASYPGASEIHSLPSSKESFFSRIFHPSPDRDRRWDIAPSFIDWTLVYPFEFNLVNVRHIL